MDQCFFLGLYQLPGGSCAQWFSGTASSLAVFVALGAHFFTAWRQKLVEKRGDAAEIAGVSMVLCRLLQEAMANARLFKNGRRRVKIWGVAYNISQRLGAIDVECIPNLDRNQADILIRYGGIDVARSLDLTIGSINVTNSGFIDYSKIRTELSVIFDKFPISDVESVLDVSSSEAKNLREKLSSVSNSVEFFLSRTRDLLADSVRVSKEFNEFCDKNGGWSIYRVDIDKGGALLASMNDDLK
jgi:hypothetical protein